mgnify:CR=1 FL=1
MDIDAVRELYDLHERRGANYPRFRKVETGTTVRMIALDDDEPCTLIYSRLGEDDADAAIAAEIEYFRKTGRPFEWKLYSHDTPADLKERLTARGFSIGEDEAIMALDLSRLPPGWEKTPDVHVRKAIDEAGRRDFSLASRAAWSGHPEAWLDSILKTLRESPARMSAWVAYADGQPACAARIDFPEGSPFASLWGGATLEPFRKRGLYTALVAARAREAIERGYRYLTIDASPMSRPIAERHGFRLLSISNPCDSPS